MIQVQNLVGGKLVTTDEVFDDISPLDNSIIAKIPRTKNVDDVVEAAINAHSEWALLSIEQRCEWLDRIADALQENINFYRSLKNEVQKQENYFGLIRMNLGKIDYHLLETNKKNLSEINTVEDLKNCKFSLKG